MCVIIIYFVSREIEYIYWTDVCCKLCENTIFCFILFALDLISLALTRFCSQNIEMVGAIAFIKAH